MCDGVTEPFNVTTEGGVEYTCDTKPLDVVKMHNKYKK